MSIPQNVVWWRGISYIYNILSSPEPRPRTPPAGGASRPRVGHDGRWTEDRDRRDIVLLFATRSLRMFAYGFLAVVLVLYLERRRPRRGGGRPPARAHAARRRRDLAAADDPRRPVRPAADAVPGLAADARGRARVRLVDRVPGAPRGRHPRACSAPAGTRSGRSSPSSRRRWRSSSTPKDRTSTFARYQVAGSVATALGSLGAGVVTQALLGTGAAPADAYRVVIVAYAVIGLVMAFIFPLLTRAVEVERPAVGPDGAGVPAPVTNRFGLHRSGGIVARLAALFALDAFGGGFVMLGFIAFWLTSHVRRRSGDGRRHPVRRQHPGRVLGAGGGSRSRPASGSSGRWCSRTCRRTCC